MEQASNLPLRHPSCDNDNIESFVSYFIGESHDYFYLLIVLDFIELHYYFIRRQRSGNMHKNVSFARVIEF